MEDVIAPIADITRKQHAANQIMQPKTQAEVNLKYNSKVRTSAAASKKEDRGRDSQRKLASH